MLQHPILAIIAILSWLVPLAALLPPATLSIENAQRLSFSQVEVPTLNFSSQSMVYQYSYVPYSTPYTDEILPEQYETNVTGAYSKKLFRLATMTATQSKIQDFPGSGANKTYQSQLRGSTLRCRNLSHDGLKRIVSFLEEDCDFYRWQYNGDDHRCGLSTDFIYYSWAPTGTVWTPGENLTKTLNFAKPIAAGKEGTRTDAIDFDIPHVLIATKTVAPGEDFHIGREWAVLNCSLHYATYETTVTSSNEHSFISNYTVEAHEEIFPNGTLDWQTSGPPWPSKPDVSDFGHLAVMGCLVRILRGHMTEPNMLSHGGESDVSKTALIFSNELVPYTAMTVEGPDLLSLEDSNHSVGPWGSFGWGGDTVYPEDTHTTATANQSLGWAIEQLYQNITLSLLRRADFLAQPEQLANVTTESWLNEYAYHEQNLLISYGIALALSLIACIYGCSSIYRNGGSYSNKFFTTLRTTKGSLEDFDALLTRADRSVMDPLPRHLAKTKLTLGYHDAAEDGFEGGGACSTAFELRPQETVAVNEQSAMMDDGFGNEPQTQRTNALVLETLDVNSQSSRESSLTCPT